MQIFEDIVDQISPLFNLSGKILKNFQLKKKTQENGSVDIGITSRVDAALKMSPSSETITVCFCRVTVLHIYICTVTLLEHTKLATK